MAQPTTRQRLAFNNLLASLGKGDAFNMEQLMMKAGYTKATAHNPEKNLIKKDGWQQLLASIDETPLLSRLIEMSTDKKDKRTALTAIQELLKLKDRYPHKDKNVVNLFNKLSPLE